MLKLKLRPTIVLYGWSWMFINMKKYIYQCLIITFPLISTLTTDAAEPKKEVICASETRRSVRQDLFVLPANGAIKVAFFDADSTLRVSKSGSVSANNPTDVRLLPNVAKALANLQKSGYLIYIVSNQNGVGSGVISCETAEGALRYTIEELFKNGGTVHGYDFAENADQFRKPGTGMADALEAKLKKIYGPLVFIDKKQSIMVGDSAFKKAKEPSDSDLRWNAKTLAIVPGTHFSNADRLFAQAVGIHFIEATDFFGWRKYDIDVIETSQELDNFLKRCQDCTP